MNTEVRTPPPLLTVAMPIFNGGEYLRAAVASIVQQSFQDWELLIIDDGSTDGSIEKIERLHDERIRIFRDGKNKGLAIRLNETLDLARGAFLARMDHDDIAHPDRFSMQLKALQADPALDLLATRCITIAENNAVTGYLPFAETRKLCQAPWRGFYMPHPTWMGRIEWFREHRYPEPGPYRCEDHELLLRSYATSRFAVLSEPLLAYRVRDTVKWRVALTTRLALYKIQRQHFWQRKQVYWCVLAAAVTVLRIGGDVYRVLKQRFAQSSSSGKAGDVVVPNAEYSFWQDLISRLQMPQEKI